MTKQAGSKTFIVRDGRDSDIPALTAIYAVEVNDGTASFELVPPDETEMRRRFQAIRQAGLPYLVAVDVTGHVLGYAYAGPYRPRPAYDATVENSVYVAAEARGHGIGRMLLADLIDRCRLAGKREMVAIIGDTGNQGSIGLHQALGFRHVGTLRQVGRKHGRWIDTVLMQLALHHERDGETDHDPL
jgi:phosphinothricin acetyltransferase